ncbi:unnamed protein product [Toxocara canis]|uniref:Methyltransf_11 domain-containing protein n=1 Tax=Toxocara canis TaxID=6265 RepID=A0A183U9G7_TOXCA|nr:unnamed protein product [Toxocara canis]
MDFVVSFSSIEHSGLGRYGDPLDPIGDLREMQKIQCLLKRGGLLFIGLPVGVDAVVFNAHRIYGRLRLAMMFEEVPSVRPNCKASSLEEHKGFDPEAVQF